MKVKAWWFTRMTGSCICRNHTVLQVDIFQNAVIIFRPLSKKIILNIHNMKSSYTFVNSAELTNASSSWPHSSPGNNHMCVLSCFSRVWLFVTPWTVACQAPLSMGFSRQGYQRGLPLPSPGHLSHPGIKPGSPAQPAHALPSEPLGKLALSAGTCPSHLTLFQLQLLHPKYVNSIAELCGTERESLGKFLPHIYMR